MPTEYRLLSEDRDLILAALTSADVETDLFITTNAVYRQTKSGLWYTIDTFVYYPASLLAESYTGTPWVMM